MTDRRAAPDLARAAEVIAARGCSIGVPLVIADETVSTNDDAKQGARAGAPYGAVWLAESQTGGRGRQGRAWLSPRGENLLLSVLFRLRCAPARVPPVSLACGLAVRDAVARALGALADNDADDDVVVKWPNDVLVRSARDGVYRKVAGVLVESGLSGAKLEYVVVGIGINVHTRALPDEVAETATSIALERDARKARRDRGGRASEVDVELDRAEILADVLDALHRDVELVAHKGLGLVHARLTRHDALAGKPVESIDEAGQPGDIRGIAAGIDLDGRLLVRSEDGKIRPVSSGEMRVRVRP